MAITHVVFHLPAGLIGIAFYHVLSTPKTFGTYVLPLWTLYLLSMSVSVFGSLADFFIYLYVFPAFRESVKFLILRACSCNSFDPRHEAVHHASARASTCQRSIVDLNNAVTELSTRNNGKLKLVSSFDSTATL